MKFFVKSVLISLLACVAFANSVGALSINESRISTLQSSLRTTNFDKTIRAAGYETYYFLSDPVSSANGTTTSSATIPLDYSVFTGDSDTQFRDYAICPYIYNDTGDFEVLPVSYCSFFTMPGFSGGTYYSSTLAGNGARLIYPGVNNIGCLVLGRADGNYQDCTSTQRVNYSGSDFPVYRFWSNTKNHHFYTIESAEKTNVVDSYDDNVWKYESMAYTATRYTGTCSWGSPVYRFWSDTKQGHFYTIYEHERNYIMATYPQNVWRFEGVAYCAYESASTSTPVYRFWSDTKQGHFYTADESEKNTIISTYPSNVWRFEGVAFWAKG